MASMLKNRRTGASLLKAKDKGVEADVLGASDWVQQAKDRQRGEGHIEGLWTKKETGVMPQVRRPPPRGGHTAFIMNPKDSRIFIFGGANGDQFLQDFYSLNTQTLKWQSVHTYYPPRARAYHSAAIVAPEQRKLARGAVPVLLLYGGFNRGDCLSDLAILEEWGVMKRGPNPPAKLEVPGHLRGKDPPAGLEEDIWGTVVPQGDVPVGRCNHSCGVSFGGRHMVVYGGWNTAFIEHVYVLNTDSWRWALKRVKDDGGMSPAPRASSASCVMRDGTWMVIHGGQDQYGQRQDMWVLDMNRFEWILVMPQGKPPSARSGHTLTYVPELQMVVLFGGWTGVTMSNEVHVMSVKGDPRKDWRWHQIKVGGDAIRGRAGHTATVLGDAMWVIGGLGLDARGGASTGTATDEVYTLQLGFRNFNFDFVPDPTQEVEELVYQTPARIVRYGEGLEAELGSPQDDVEDRAAQLRRRLQSDRAQALKREKEQQMWDAQAREQQINLIRKRVIDRAMVAGATYEEAVLIADDEAGPELLERVAANSKALREGGVAELPPPPGADQAKRPITTQRSGSFGMRRSVHTPTVNTTTEPEPQDELESILQTGGVGAGAGVEVVEGEDPDMRRLRIEHASAAGRPQDSAIAARPRRRQGGPKRPDVPADAGLDPGSLDTIDEEEGDSDGEGPSGPSGAAGGDLTVAPRANSELLRIAAGKSVLNAGAVMVPRAQGDREGEEGSAMAAMMQRAARLVQERWRHHKMLRLQLAVKAVIRIQAWVRGYKVRKTLREQGVVLPNSWLLEADAMTKREKKYKERLADAHRRATQKQSRAGDTRGEL